MKHRRVLHYLAALVGVCLAPLVLAKVINNTIDPVAIVSGNGLHVMLTGPIACTEGERCLIPCDELAAVVSSSIDGLALQMAAGVPLPQQAATRAHVLRALLALVPLPPTHPHARDHRSTDEVITILWDEERRHDT